MGLRGIHLVPYNVIYIEQNFQDIKHNKPHTGIHEINSEKLANIWDKI